MNSRTANHHTSRRQESFRGAAESQASVLDARRSSAADFSESVRIVGGVAREMKLRSPAFRSPPRITGVNRSIQHRGAGSIVAVRRDDRPLAAVQADIVDGVIAANRLEPLTSDRFRHRAWSALDSDGLLSPAEAGFGTARPSSVSRVLRIHRGTPGVHVTDEAQDGGTPVDEIVEASDGGAGTLHVDAA